MIKKPKFKLGDVVMYKKRIQVIHSGYFKSKFLNWKGNKFVIEETNTEEVLKSGKISSITIRNSFEIEYEYSFNDNEDDRIRECQIIMKNGIY